MKKREYNGRLLELKNCDKYITVEELFIKSQPTSVYYTLLILSTLIIACGLLLNNPTIVIGGMLVTPLLTPILVIALGISTGEARAIKTSAILVLKSVATVIVVSFILAIVFRSEGSIDLVSVDDSLRTAILYFVVAFLSGVAATFAWVRKEITEILPGIAVAVSLVPPMSMIGIYLSIFDFYTLRLFCFLFLSLIFLELFLEVWLFFLC